MESKSPRKGTASDLAKEVIGPLVDKLIEEGVIPPRPEGYSINDEPDYGDAAGPPSLMEQYQAAWRSKFGPGGTHSR